MTALVAIENCPLDKVVTVSPEAVGVEGSSVYLYAGENITMESLLYALLLQSANDAAAAIAYEVAGGIDRFADLMNERASSLGLVDTHFKNPHGLDDEDHYTTARELAIIASEALKNDTFRRIVSTKRIIIPMQNGSSTRLLINHNRLLREYDDVIGVKTGYTKKCGRTLVSAAERDGVTLVAVTLCDGDDWRDHRAMLDYGFDLYEKVTLFDPDEPMFYIGVDGGTATSVGLKVRGDGTFALRKDRGKIAYEASFPFSVGSDIKEGQTLGKIVFYCGERKLGEFDLCTAGDARANTVLTERHMLWKRNASRNSSRARD